MTPVEHRTVVGASVANLAISEALEGKIADLKSMASRLNLIDLDHALALLT